MVEVQRLKDLRGARDELERRVHDLKLTRQVTMQGLPSIRMVQENDKGLINKINSTLVNTVPLWRQQLAQAVTIYRSGEAADTIKRPPISPTTCCAPMPTISNRRMPRRAARSSAVSSTSRWSSTPIRP
jgi:uncharacterized protein YaaN involved in tellurite resistance